VGDGLLDRVLHLVPLLLVRARDVFLILNLHPAPGEDDRVLLAVAEVEEHPGRTLSHRWSCLFLLTLHDVVFCTDELAGVAETLASIGKVEWGGVAIKGGICVARFSLNLFEESALQLRARLTPTKLRALLAFLVKPFLESLPYIFHILVDKIFVSQIAVSWWKSGCRPDSCARRCGRPAATTFWFGGGGTLTRLPRCPWRGGERGPGLGASNRLEGGLCGLCPRALGLGGRTPAGTSFFRTWPD